MKNIYIFLGVLLFCAKLLAQQFTVSVNIRNPAPTLLQEWKDNPSIVQVVLTNQSSIRQQVVIGINLTNTSNRRTVSSINDHPCMPTFVINSGETRIINGSELICQEALTIPSDIRTSVITSGQLPEGDYEFCVTVIDANDRRTEFASTGVKCALTRVIWPDPPVIISPTNSDGMQYCDRPILLQWQPLAPTPSDGVQYRVRVVGIFQGQIPRQALETATDRETIVNEITTATSLIITANNPILLDLLGRNSPRLIGLAWQVEALSMERIPIPTRGGTNGKSEIASFSLECSNLSLSSSCSGPLNLEAYYPTDNDTIPWIPPLLVVRWSPFCDGIIGMTYSLTVSDGTSSYTNTRNLNWPDGPIIGQGLSSQPNAEIRASLIIVNQWDASGREVEWNSRFRRGNHYSWTTSATFTRREGRDERTYSVTTGTRNFNLGLKMPINPEPHDGSTIAPGREITLAWNIPEPTNWSKEYLDQLLTMRGSGHSGLLISEALELVKVKIARDTTFASSIANFSMRFPESGGNYISFNENVREIFGRKQRNLSGLGLTNGRYFWRVEYYSPFDTLTPYRSGPIWSFRIGATEDTTDCISVQPREPGNRSTVTTPNDGRVRFSIETQPNLNLNALTRCRFRIWGISNIDEDPSAVRTRRPILDVTLPATEGNRPLREISRGGNTTIYLLEFINQSGGVHNFTATSGQSYLWECELEFDRNRIRSDGTPCNLSTKICYGVFTFRNGECNDPCVVRSPSNTAPFSGTLNTDDIIRIGNFEAELVRVSGTSENLSGEALVRLPWFGIRIRTRFEGVSVNSERQVYRGEFRAIQAGNSPIDEELANRITTELGLSNTQLNAINDFLVTNRRLVSAFTSNQPLELPIGFDQTIDGFSVSLGIIGMVFRPTGAYLNAVFVVPLPWLGPGQSLGFGVRNLCFSPNGLGRSYDMYLARDLGYRHSDDSWSFNFKAPQEARSGLPRDSGTFVRINCGGFEFLRVSAEVEFPRSWLLPSPDDGHSKVILRFTSQIRNINNFILTGRMTPFSIVGASGFVFSCENATVDFSDIDNPDDIRFPEGYRGTTTSQWRGFFIKNLSMQFPEELRRFSSTSPLTINVQNLLIDNQGVNFDVLGLNVISYPDGNFGDWGASLDTVGISIVNSSLRRGWISGQIKVPISDSSLNYYALLRDTVGGIRFEFSIRPRGTLNVPLWIATINIDNTSRINIEYGSERRFIARALFNGSISLTGTSDIPLNFEGIRFQNMLIQTHQTPYISVGTWSFASPQHNLLVSTESSSGSRGSNSRAVGGFPVSISEFNIVSGGRTEGPGVGLRIGVSVNLQGGERAISGTTAISIWGAYQTSSRPPTFVFSGIDLDSIGIRADLGSVEISGSVRFYNNDSRYGNGFRGAVRANFVRMVQVAATVQFGSIAGPPSYRYWYVDAQAIIASGIPVFTGVGIYGFGGGAWYNMRRASDPAPVTPTGSSSTTTSASSGSPGSTNSGARYEPYYSRDGETFGFYALVTIGTHPEPKAFNCDVRLEVTFVGGGIDAIRLRGDGWMMAGLMERSRAPVRLTADISYTFPTRTFHGDFGVTVSLEAVRANGRMVIHFAPDIWYVKIGDPEGERINVNVLNNLIQLQAYFMAGMGLPSNVPLPSEVRELVGEVPSPLRPSELGRGDGFAFGASANFAPPELRFLIFYANMRFLIGFDMALLNYGATARCSDGRPMGANGWYATGQMYARVDASVGLHVDLVFVSGKFEILGLRIGAALQAGTPNPTWLAGAVGGDYSILGGAIRGHCDFRFTLGERCTPTVESPLASLDLISDIAPRDGETNVSLFAEPTAFFNFEPDRPFALEAMREDGSTETKVYRIRVGTFRLLGRDSYGGFTRLVPTTGPVVRSTREAPARAIIPTEPLQGLAQYRAEVTAYGQEYTGGSFQRRPGETIEQASQRASSELASVLNWQDVRRSGGGRVEQQVVSTFTTQARPDTVPAEWVYIAHPRPMQRFFLQDECRDGSITLLVNQNWIFPTAGSQRRVGDTIQLFRARFINLETGERMEVPITYQRTPRPYAIGERRRTADVWGGEIRFQIPRLANEKIFAVQIIRRDSVVQRASTTSGVWSTVLDERTRRAISGSTTDLFGTRFRRLLDRGGSTLEVGRRYRPSGFDVGRAVASNEKLLYVYYFRTSRYNRLEDKIRATSTERTEPAPFGNIVFGLSPYLTNSEGFDPHDLMNQTVTASPTGTIEQEYSLPPLIVTSATTRSDRWHREFVNPRVYDELAWLYRLTRSSSLYYNSWWLATVRDRFDMLDVLRTSHSLLSDMDIAAAPGDPTYRLLARMLSAPLIQIDESGLRGISFRPSGSRSTALYYSQPGYIFLDWVTARNAAAYELRWCSESGDVGYDRSTCSRLRRIATQRFVNPISGEYTTWWNYLLCQDPDSPRSYQFRFNYGGIDPRMSIPIR